MWVVLAMLAVAGGAGRLLAQAPAQDQIGPDGPNLAGSIASWKLSETGASASAFATTEGVILMVDQTDGTDWHAQFMHDGIDLQNGRRYDLRFRARAAVARQIAAYGQSDSGDFHFIGLNKVFVVTPEWATYDVVFTPTDAPQGHTKIAILVGQSRGRVDLASIALTPASPEAETHAPSPAAPGSVGPIAQWDLETDGRAVANVLPSAGGAQIVIDDADSVPSHVVLRQDGVTLDSGKAYTLAFKAKSTTSRPVMLVVGRDDAAGSTDLNRTVLLTPEWSDYVVKFTPGAPVPLHTRIAFLMGAAASTIDLSDVTLATQ